MKKFLCLVISFMLLLGTVTSAAGLDFLTDGTMMNYSANDTVTMELDVPTDFLNELLEQFGGSEIENYIDLEALLKGLVAQSQTAQIAVKISEDFKRIEMSMEAESLNDITFNRNLDVSVRMKSAIWLDLDLTDAANPKFYMIYSDPSVNKYVTLDLFAMMDTMGSAEEKAQIITMLTTLYDREVLQPLMERSRALIEEYATVKVENRVYTIHFDSAAFSKYIAAVINEVIDLYVPMGLIEPAQADVIKQTVLLYATKISLLGEDGYTLTYSLTSKKTVQKMTADMDFEICLKDIVALFDATGESWPFESEGRIGLRMQEEMKIKLSGDSVTVKYPTLTEENSISYIDLYGVEPEPVYPDNEDVYEDYAPQYPYFYINSYASQLPQVDGKYYVPLRTVLESGYYDEFAIDFAADETITITSPWFDTIQTKIGATTATVNGVEIPVDEVILLDGTTTYVSQSFFENLFGWRLVYVVHYLQYGEYSIEFETFPNEEAEEF